MGNYFPLQLKEHLREIINTNFNKLWIAEICISFVIGTYAISENWFGKFSLTSYSDRISTL